MASLIEVTISIAGPMLLAALVGGILIGVIQTATQIQEMSLAFVVKAGCVLIVFLLAGSTLADITVRYTRAQLKAVAEVVR